MIKFRHSCRGGHMLLPVAAKACKNAFAAESRHFAKTKSTNQRKVGFLQYTLRRQFKSFALPPALCKRSTVVEFFSFAVGLFQQAFANSRRQFGGLNYHQQSVNAVLLTISFPLPTWATAWEWVLCCSLVSVLCFLVYI